LTLNSGHRKWLETNMGDSVSFNSPLSGFTSFGTGGPADAIVTPVNRDSLRKLILWTKHSGLKVFTIGKGTNLLFSDRGYPGIVISLNNIHDQVVEKKTGDQIILTAPAGMKLQRLCLLCVNKGYDGLVFATGIPGTVGGGIYMNAGTSSGCFGDILLSLEVMFPDGRILHVSNSDMEFSYRNFMLKQTITDIETDKLIFLGCDLKLKKGNSGDLKESYDRYYYLRKSKHPLDKKNAGSFFKNPEGDKTAGELIEQAGLKGTKSGDAEVSEKHANFLVNNGNATTQDLLDLMKIVQNEVKDAHDIWLTPEVRIIG